MLILHPFTVKMKCFCFFVLIIAIAACTPHQKKQAVTQLNRTGNDVMSPFMYFKEDTYNAGNIMQGEKVMHTYILENKGKKDLIIESVSASCGCTVANWNKKPVPSGKMTEIEVIFNSANRFGPQLKTITVKSNAVPDIKMLTLKCEVVLPNN